MWMNLTASENKGNNVWVNFDNVDYFHKNTVDEKEVTTIFFANGGQLNVLDKQEEIAKRTGG